MDILLQNKDHGLDSRGYPRTLYGKEELAQQAIIRLSVPKGSFPLDPDLGSLLYTLGQAGEFELSGLCDQYVQQALAPIAGLRVIATSCRYLNEDELLVTVELDMNGDTFSLPIELAV